MITVEQLTAAFAAWESGYRANPENFMTEAEVAAMEVADVSEARAIYFYALLRDVGAVN